MAAIEFNDDYCEDDLARDLLAAWRAKYEEGIVRRDKDGVARRAALAVLADLPPRQLALVALCLGHEAHAAEADDVTLCDDVSLVMLTRLEGPR